MCITILLSMLHWYKYTIRKQIAAVRSGSFRVYSEISNTHRWYEKYNGEVCSPVTGVFRIAGKPRGTVDIRKTLFLIRENIENLYILDGTYTCNRKR